ncbi:hypothetical protein ACSBR2_041466 [Camellia fascicularis]
MDTLISSDEDVHVLRKARIIRNHLGAREDAKLFNNLYKEVVLKESYFAETISAADRYSKVFWSKFMARLRRKYFASPWTFMALVAGLSLLPSLRLNSSHILSISISISPVYD